MSKPRNASREIVVSLLVAVVVGGGIAAYVLHSMPSRKELATSYIGPQASDAKAPDDLEVARAVVNEFVAALAAKRYEDAYARMADPYRAAVSLEAFRAACASSAFLAHPARGVVFSTQRMAPGGTTQPPYTLRGRGVIVSDAGSINADITLLVNGRDARILVLALAGVPVLNGVAPRAPAHPR